MPYHCSACLHRLVWCHWCRIKHCACKPHVSRASKYLRKNHTIRMRKGGTRMMSARRYAHLKGAQKGGQVTATRPNPGRFTPETARIAAGKRRKASRKLHERTGLVMGRRRRIVKPRLSRPALRQFYSQDRGLGIHYSPETIFDPSYWIQTMPDGSISIISECTALRRLGHLKFKRKNWVPEADEVIVATQVGMFPAERKARRTHG